MQPETSELLQAAREVLAVTPAELDRAHERFVGRLDAEAQRGGWRNRSELAPIAHTFLRLFVFGLVAFVVVVWAWTSCSPYEELQKRDEQEQPKRPGL